MSFAPPPRHTRDYDRALEFYRAVFGRQTETVSDTSDIRYQMPARVSGG
jgi:predicted enzyme related to lactoylglutathione lyase